MKFGLKGRGDSGIDVVADRMPIARPVIEAFVFLHVFAERAKDLAHSFRMCLIHLCESSWGNSQWLPFRGRRPRELIASQMEKRSDRLSVCFLVKSRC
jgi:hypothetical protein